MYSNVFFDISGNSSRARLAMLCKGEVGSWWALRNALLAWAPLNYYRERYIQRQYKHMHIYSCWTFASECPMFDNQRNKMFWGSIFWLFVNVPTRPFGSIQSTFFSMQGSKTFCGRMQLEKHAIDLLSDLLLWQDNANQQCVVSVLHRRLEN